MPTDSERVERGDVDPRVAAENLTLRPQQLLDDRWQPSGPLPAQVESYGGFGPPATEEEQWARWLHRTRIELSPVAQTEALGQREQYRYYRTEVGMNIILPRGSIEELRFRLKLMPQGKVVAVDGFPKEMPGGRALPKGKVKVCLNKLFHFVPVVGSSLAEVVDVRFGPWEFELGSFRRGRFNFSGGLSAIPEWYFRGNATGGAIRVTLTLKQLEEVSELRGEATAAWVYNPGIFRKARLGSGTRILQLDQK